MEEGKAQHNTQHKRPGVRDGISDKNLSVKQIGSLYGDSQAYRLYSTDGISPTLQTNSGGGRVPHILIYEDKERDKTRVSGSF